MGHKGGVSVRGRYLRGLAAVFFFFWKMLVTDISNC